MSRPFRSFRRLHARRLLPLLAVLVAATGASCAGDAGTAARQERTIAPGVRLLKWTQNGTQDAGPEALFAVDADLGEPLVRLGVSVGKGTPVGLEPISLQAARVTMSERYPIAGVNGDFFYYPDSKQGGISTNALVLGGEVIRSPYPRSCLVIDGRGRPSIRVLSLRASVTLSDGSVLPITAINHPRTSGQLVLFTPRFGASTHADARGTEVFMRPDQPTLRHGTDLSAQVRAVQSATGEGAIAPDGWVLSGSGAATSRLNGLKPGDTLRMRLDFDPPLGPDDQVIGGGPRLVRDGKVAVETEGGSVNGAFSTARYPRTAVGYSHGHVFLLVVDGRQPGYSAGMSLPELAQAMVDLGCSDAMNLDGGGSTTLWARGAVVNRPSDGRERPVADGLLLFSTAPHGPTVRVVATPAEIDALPGAEVPLSAGGEDAANNPVMLPGEPGVQWSLDSRLGTVVNGVFRAAAKITPDTGKEYAAGSISALAGSIGGTLSVHLYPRPARLELAPSALRIGPRSQTRMRVRAFNREGHPLLLPESLEWKAAPAIGIIDSAGNLVTGAAAGTGEVTVSVDGVSATARIELADAASQALDDFEKGGEWTMRATPAGVTGSVSIASGAAHSGTHTLRIHYDLSAGTGTRAVYAIATRPLGKPFAVKCWVYGDGEGEWLRARLRDGKGATVTLDLARTVDWKNSWHELRAPLSDDVPGPLTLEAIYVVEPDPSRHPKGTILIDDLSVDK